MTFHVYIISPPWHLTTNKANVFVYRHSPIQKIRCSFFNYSFVQLHKSGGETYCMLDKSGVGEHAAVKPAERNYEDSLTLKVLKLKFSQFIFHIPYSQTQKPTISQSYNAWPLGAGNVTLTYCIYKGKVIVANVFAHSRHRSNGTIHSHPLVTWWMHVQYLLPFMLCFGL